MGKGKLDGQMLQPMSRASKAGRPKVCVTPSTMVTPALCIYYFAVQHKSSIKCMLIHISQSQRATPGQLASPLQKLTCITFGEKGPKKFVFSVAASCFIIIMGHVLLLFVDTTLDMWRRRYDYAFLFVNLN